MKHFNKTNKTNKMKIKKTSREIKIHHTTIVDGIPYYRNESLTYDTNGILAEHKLDWSVGDEEGEGPYVTPGGTLDHIKKETPESLEEKFTQSSRTLRNYAKSKLWKNKK
jgi:hypothetical protein